MSVTILFRSLFLIDIAFADLFLKNICCYFWWTHGESNPDLIHAMDA